MIDIEQLAPHAHRIVVYGEVTAGDMARFAAFARDEVAARTRKSVLIDVVSFAAVSFAAVREELSHLAVLFRWAFSLDRIAIVSDEAWIRAASRVESALLPGLSYAVYDETEEPRAREWVMGGAGGAA